MLFSIVILLILILISGVLASSEIAISSSNRNKVKMRADKGDKKAARLLETIDEPHNFFATTQLYITFIAFFSGAYAAASFAEPLAYFTLSAGLPVSEGMTEALTFILVTAVLTYVSLIIGELVPKRLAMRYAIPYSIMVLPFLNVLSIIAMPIVKLLSASAKLVLKLIRFKDDSSEDDITKEDIRLMVESGSEHGSIAESEQGMIENIFKLDKFTAGDICTYRLDVAALPLGADFKTVIDMLTGENYTRIPIYEDTLDNICGILHSKDVLHYITTNPDISGFNIKMLLRDAYFVPHSKKSDELFQEMRKERVYMAVVIDEYGGTMGIVTIEDLVEKIVGSIQDEYDLDELPDIVPVNEDENSFRIQGTADLEEVQNRLDVPLPIDEYETLSGFLVGQLGYIPDGDETPEITFGNLFFKIESVQDKRIAVALVTKTAEEGSE
ncbi:MAG: hemolysin family protein [Defluviitaleaceae bacterium]|nr:hemolysin family protein [Defluviitaleaceae bacterium]